MPDLPAFNDADFEAYKKANTPQFNDRAYETYKTGVQQGKIVGGPTMASEAVEGMPVIGALGPKAGAAFQAATQPWLGLGSNAPTYEQRRDENLARHQARQDTFKQEYPVQARGAQLGGAALATLPLTTLAPELFGIMAPEALAGTYASWPARLALGATTGQGMYAADAAARGQPITREGLGTAAATGALLPGAAGVLGASGRTMAAFPETTKFFGGYMPSVLGGLAGLHFGSPEAGGLAGMIGLGMKKGGETAAEWLANRMATDAPQLRWPYTVTPGASQWLQQQNQPPQTPYGAQ